MKINTLHFRNFKLLHDVEIEPGNVNVIIGANGSGKSTVLEAIGLLSLAMTDRINDSTLKSKGIRLSVPSAYKSSFEEYKKSSTIGMQIEWEESHKFKYSVDLNTPSDLHEWRYHSELLDIDNSRAWGRSGRSETYYDDSVGMLMLDNNERLFEARPSIEWMKNYAVYQPSTPVLRSVLQESEPVIPVGLNGGRLAEAIEEILHEENEDIYFGSIELDEILDLIDWADGLTVSYPNKKNTNPFVSTARRVIEFHDSFMKQKDKFTGYDASEGALYVLFLACLALHPKAPRIFAVDNFDQSLNPRLTRAVTRKFCKMIIDNGKTVFLTTHNPLTLDGLDLMDSRIRLFTIDRSRKTGEAVFRRVEINKDLVDKDMPLSRLWTSGVIGGVPNL